MIWDIPFFNDSVDEFILDMPQKFKIESLSCSN